MAQRVAAQTPSAANCPAPAEVEPSQLLGRWVVEVEGQAPATLHLKRHPESPESLAGEVQRGDATARVVADLDEGEFTLEESTDGTTISAVWVGQPVAGDCGRSLRGDWRAAGTEVKRPFVMRRAIGW